MKEPYKVHYHKTRTGKVIECYHACKSILADYAFWVGTLVSWPLEHYLFSKVWPFKLVAKFLGIE
jgi:hypothetical protein